MNKRLAQIRVFCQGSQSRIVPLTGPCDLRIGDSLDADIQAPTDNPGGECSLHVDEHGQCFLQTSDLSSNALLNGRAIEGSRRLFSGDQVQLGYITLLFLVVTERKELYAHAS